MANLLSELDRFEEEMQQIGAASAQPPVPPPHLVAQVPLPPPPRLPGSQGPPAAAGRPPPHFTGHAFPGPPPPFHRPPPPGAPREPSGLAPSHFQPPVQDSSTRPHPSPIHPQGPPFLGSQPGPSPGAPSPVSSWAPNLAFPPTSPTWHVTLTTPPPGAPYHPADPSAAALPATGYPGYGPAPGPGYDWGAAPAAGLHPDQGDIQSLLSSGHTVASGPVVSAPPALTRDAINVEAQELFQKDAALITPEALATVKAALAAGDGGAANGAVAAEGAKASTGASGGASGAQAGKKRAVPRKAAGETWEDPTLVDFPENDHRLFCGDLGNEVTDDVLTRAFTKYGSFNLARVVRDKRTGKTKGYGFVSFGTPGDCAAALKEMNGKYIGNRPVKLRKSNWKERVDEEALNQRFRKKPKKSKHVLHS